MNWLKNHLLAIIIIFASILIVYFSRSPMSHWLVKQKIKNDVVILSQLYTGVYLLSFNQINTLQKQLNFLCDKNDLEKMNEILTHNLFVEYIDLHLPNGQRCSMASDDRSAQSLVAFPENDQLIFGKISLIVAENQFEEIRSHSDQGVLRFIFQPPSNLLSNCDKCLNMVMYVNNHEILLHEKGQYPNLIVYDDKRNNSLSVKLYINENGVAYLVSELVNLFSILIILLSALIAVSIELCLSERRGISGLLNKAIQCNALQPFYQPIVKPVGDHYQMVGAEVLVRWRASSGEYIPPDTFIPLAEQNGSIDKITNQVIDNVIRHIKSISLPESFFISVNVSPGYLEKPNIAKKLLKKMEMAGLDPHVLSLEITERTKFSDLNKAAVNIELLTEKGISIKLDDCGTGYGAFSYLHILNIDTIKIDRMFVDGIGSKNFNNNILDSILAFARQSNLQVVAEGIETQAQADYLINAGVEMLQGAFFGEPVPFNVFVNLIEK